MSDLGDKIRSEAALADRPGQMARLEQIAAEVDQLERELDRTKRGARTLGEIIDRQITDLLRWAGMEDQIGLDDPDQQTAWERVAEKVAQADGQYTKDGTPAREPYWPAIEAAAANLGYFDPNSPLRTGRPAR